MITSELALKESVMKAIENAVEADVTPERIDEIIKSLVSLPLNPREKAAATLSQIIEGDTVNFKHANVNYEGTVKKINTTTATVKITKIHGSPRRAIFVGTEIRVGATLLKRGSKMQENNGLVLPALFVRNAKFCCAKPETRT